MATRIIRKPAVIDRIDRSRSSLDNDIANGCITHPISIGPRAVGWPEYEVEEIIRARIVGKSDDEIRELVAKLEAARNEAFREEKVSP